MTATVTVTVIATESVAATGTGTGHETEIAGDKHEAGEAGRFELYAFLFLHGPGACGQCKSKCSSLKCVWYHSDTLQLSHLRLLVSIIQDRSLVTYVVHG